MRLSSAHTEDPNILRIPLRLPPGVIPNIRPEDIILEDGDIVMIDSREAEVFYTGGLLPGGEWPIPRDYDLDILGAMAIAGGGIAGSAQGMGGAERLVTLPTRLVACHLGESSSSARLLAMDRSI